MLLLLLLHYLDCSPFTCDLGWWCNSLVIHHGGAVQLVECHFDSWDSGDLKFGIYGIDETSRSLVWASISSFYPSLLEIPIDLATVRP